MQTLCQNQLFYSWKSEEVFHFISDIGEFARIETCKALVKDETSVICIQDTAIAY